VIAETSDFAAPVNAAPRITSERARNVRVGPRCRDRSLDGVSVKRRAPTSVRRLRRGAVRAFIGSAIALALALLVHWLSTPLVGSAMAAGWVSGFLRATPEGLAHWNPSNLSAHVSGGYTDWSPDLVYDGEPLPEDIVARYWCEYRYEREKLWVLAPLVERATVDLRISDPNFAPASPALVRRYEPAAARFVVDQVNEARSGPTVPFWTRTFDVANLRARSGSFWRVYWLGAPAQIGATMLLAASGGMLVWSAWRLRRALRADAPVAHPLCPRCLYDVSGQDVTACPECAQALVRDPEPVMGPVIITLHTPGPRPIQRS